jgi:hypothetical protein
LKYWVFGPSSLANQTDQRDAAGYSMKWTNISFLEIQTPKAPVGQEHGMFEAHFSFVICGSHERRWTAYAFDDTEFDGEDLYEKIFPHNGFHSDPIVSDGDTDAELPIWDAREYFLRTVSSRVASAADSWDELLRQIEHSIQKYVSANSLRDLDQGFSHPGILTTPIESPPPFYFITPQRQERRPRRNCQDFRLDSADHRACEQITKDSLGN